MPSPWIVLMLLSLLAALGFGWLTWVARFTWQDQRLTRQYALLGAAAAIVFMLVGVWKL